MKVKLTGENMGFDPDEVFEVVGTETAYRIRNERTGTETILVWDFHTEEVPDVDDLPKGS